MGNIIQQGPHTENPTIVSFGAEGYRWQRNAIYLINDTLVDDLPQGGRFLSIRPGADNVEVLNNLLAGRGGFDADRSWKVAGNARAEPDDMPLAGIGDYRLDSASKLIRTAVDPGAANGVSLRLEREYVHPHDSRTLHRAASNPEPCRRCCSELSNSGMSGPRYLLFVGGVRRATMMRVRESDADEEPHRSIVVGASGIRLRGGGSVIAWHYPIGPALAVDCLGLGSRAASLTS